MTCQMAARLSIRDLAKIAGVSRTTVSLALRDSQRISAPVRKRIQELAAQHNYRSHPMVAALMHQIRAKRTLRDQETIAFVTSDVTEDRWKKWPWVRELQAGATEEANRLGFRLEVFWAGPGAKHAGRLASVLYHRGIKGLLFPPMLWPHPVFSMPWERFAPLACTASTGIMDLPVIRTNHTHGMRMLLSRLAELEARSIGVAVTDEDDLRIGRAWSSGIASFSLDVKKPRVHLLRLESYEDFEAFAAWFQRTKPDVVVGIRSEVPAFLKRLGLTPGVDIAYASLHVLTAELGTIAGFYQDAFYIARKAVQYISKAIYDQSFGLPERRESIVIDGSFVDGASLRPLSARLCPPTDADGIK